MNNIKKMILGFAAVAMIVSFSAFKSTPKNANLDTYYYGYDLTNNRYQKLPGAPDTGDCLPIGERCVVESATDLGTIISVESAEPLQQAPGSEDNAHYPF